MNVAGKKTTSKSEMNYYNNTLYNANEKAAYYVLVPPTQTIVDPEDNSSVLEVFTSIGTITVGNQVHTIYQSNGTSRRINAIKIGDGVVETVYYWYVGHENPMEMTSITPLPSNDASAGAGWRTIGTTLPTYTKDNPLWSSNNVIQTKESPKATQYVALPSDNIKSRNDITGADITEPGWTIESTKKTLNGVQYTIWISNDPPTRKSFGETLY
jgi:hypothetical protein